MKETGIVIYQSPDFWLEVDQIVLDLKKQGIKSSRAYEAARLMRIGLAQQNETYRLSDEFVNSILDRHETS